jgi:transcriptional regulator with XRE-family HTH domain
LAKKLEISQAMVSKLESGDYNPTIEQLWKLSKKLGWKFTVLLEEEVLETLQIWDMSEESIDIKDNIYLLVEGA